MGIKTKIEWCDSTVNPTSGCLGCELWTPGRGGTCYAAKMHARLFAQRPGYGKRFDQIQLHRGRVREAAKWPDLRGKARPDKPWLDGQPRTIFIGDMGEVFSPSVSRQYLLVEVIEPILSDDGQRHFWYLVTKQPGRARRFGEFVLALGLPWPQNLGLMVSVTDQRTADVRIPELLQCTFAPRLEVSAEPLLGPIDMTEVSYWQCPTCGREGTHSWSICRDHPDVAMVFRPGVNWVIVGGESGPHARPCDIDWIRSIVRQCEAAGVACFVKQLGAKPCGGHLAECIANGLNHPKGADPSEWPEDVRVRPLNLVSLPCRQPALPLDYDEDDDDGPY